MWQELEMIPSYMIIDSLLFLELAFDRNIKLDRSIKLGWSRVQTRAKPSQAD
jgi:hypothetical protein